MSATVYPQKLNSTEFQPYFKGYIDLAGQENALDSLKLQLDSLRELLADMDNELALTVHEPYQWNIKQVVGHLIDVEKIFGVRAHRIVCDSKQALPGFDQDLFVDNSAYDHVSLNDLFQEFETIRKSNILMFNRWTTEMWSQIGICDGKSISVRAIVCLLVGHVNHHLAIIRKRLAQ